jgi:hypothetical protein
MKLVKQNKKEKRKGKCMLALRITGKYELLAQLTATSRADAESVPAYCAAATTG